MNPFVLLVGPTAAGKSALGLKLARHFGAGILNCDSVQAYRRLDIGTAKPTPAEQAMAPHFLFGTRSPGESLTAGDYRKEALAVLNREIPKRMMIGVGGSGFYVQALEKGMFDIDKPDPEIERQVRGELEENGLAWVYDRLRGLDPETAASLSPNDAYRITRALIVVRGGGEKLSALKKRFKPAPFPYPLLKLGLTLGREDLRPRVRARTETMLKAGLLEEARRLVEEGFENWAPLQSVGYKECLQVLRGELGEDKLADQISEKTLQLAKKQRTWFQRDPGIHWLHPETALEEAVARIQAFSP
ncbi:MAG TPA: tRNA (adenosine(37)-N6)-dimethylallyltransferase MiaA [Bdellovibrionales bacterium]|nr:tRNA (adenosine(37)-N6)-dimethylallyltransferase MiaA [Bdellovibrionales bacterium]